MNKNIYTDQVIAFVTQSVRYCAMLAPESQCQWDSEALASCQKILAGIYTTALSLPSLPSDPFTSLERTVTEREYERVRQLLEGVFAEEDMFLDTEVQDMVYSDTPIGVSLSESMADLYQYLADAMWVFREGVERLKEQAIAEIAYTFRHEWGVTLLTVLRQLHRITSSQSIEDETEDSDSWDEEIDQELF